MVELSAFFDFSWCVSEVIFLRKNEFEQLTTHEWGVLQNSCFWSFLKTMILRIPYSKNHMVLPGVFFDIWWFSEVIFLRKNKLLHAHDWPWMCIFQNSWFLTFSAPRRWFYAFHILKIIWLESDVCEKWI